MFPPGAATAGLKKKSPVGPKEVKEGMSPPRLAASGNWKHKDAPAWGKVSETDLPQVRGEAVPEADLVRECECEKTPAWGCMMYQADALN